MQNHSAFAGSFEDITATSETVAASISLRTTYITTNDDDDLDIVSLADGVQGDEKIFIVEAINAGDSVKITPANANGFTQITFADSEQGAGCIMVMGVSAWSIVGNNGGTIA